MALWLFAIALFSAVASPCADWLRFRGPNGSGVADETGLPVEFGPAKNVRWRIALPAGTSSPVVAGDRVYVTGHEGSTLITLCVDVRSGKLLWRQSVDKARQSRFSPPNNSAAPTPVAGGSNVYAFFPEYGLVSYTAVGKERWRIPLGPFDPPHGMATSPIIAGDNVVLAVDQVSESYISAFSTRDGKLAWKTTRPSLVGGYSTPVTLDAGKQIVVSSPLELTAYSSGNGKKQWAVERMGVLAISVPVVSDGVFFVNNAAVPPFEDLAITFKADKNNDGRLTPDEFPDPAFKGAVVSIDRVYGNGDGAIDNAEWNGALKLMQGLNALVAVRPGSRELWRVTKGLSDVPSPVIYEKLLYMIKDGGILTALDTKTGETVKQLRLTGALDKYFASPVAAGGRLYLTSESGKVVVVRAGAELEVLAINDLAEDSYATPAISHGSLFVRTKTALYRFTPSPA